MKTFKFARLSLVIHLYITYTLDQYIYLFNSELKIFLIQIIYTNYYVNMRTRLKLRNQMSQMNEFTIKVLRMHEAIWGWPSLPSL